MTKLIARYEDYEAFKNALRALKERRQRDYTAYGPTNLEEIDDLMPVNGSKVRGFATTGALIGLVFFWLMCVLASLVFNLIVGGKPPVTVVPFIVPVYEGTILVGGIAAFVAGIALAMLGPRKPPEDYSPRFSQDSYGIELFCAPNERNELIDLLTSTGAVEVNEPGE